MPQESHTELDTTTLATVSSEPSTTSTEPPTTDSGAADETTTCTLVKRLQTLLMQLQIIDQQ